MSEAREPKRADAAGKTYALGAFFGEGRNEVIDPIPHNNSDGQSP